MYLVATKSKKAIFSKRVNVRVIDLGVFWKGVISWVCMPNMEVSISSYSEVKVDSRPQKSWQLDRNSMPPIIRFGEIIMSVLLFHSKKKFTKMFLQPEIIKNKIQTAKVIEIRALIKWTAKGYNDIPRSESKPCWYEAFVYSSWPFRSHVCNEKPMVSHIHSIYM